MILVILLLLSFLLGTWLLTRQGETRPTRPAVFHADLRSGTYREIDPVTQLEINPRHKPDSREALDDFFGSRPIDARPNRRHCREISPGFRSQRDFAEVELVTCVACTERWLKSYTYSVMWQIHPTQRHEPQPRWMPQVRHEHVRPLQKEVSRRALSSGSQYGQAAQAGQREEVAVL